GLTDRNGQFRARGQEHVHARPELHESDALAACHALSFVDPADDAAREHTDDLPHDDRLSIPIDPELVALVLAGVLAVRGPELSRAILDSRDASLVRRAVDVDVERRQED